MSAALQVVPQPDTADLRAENSELVRRAQTILITDNASFAAAVEFMNDCSARRNTIIQKFREPKQKAHEAHKAICALENELLTVVDAAEREAKKRIGEYRVEQERRANEERLRLEAEARRRERDRRLAEALDAEADGDSATAMQIIAEPIEPPPVNVAPPTPKIGGVQFRETWNFNLESIVAVAKHVAAHPEDANLLQLNTTAVRQMVNARKSLFSIPGIRAYSTKNVAAGGRR